MQGKQELNYKALTFPHHTQWEATGGGHEENLFWKDSFSRGEGNTPEGRETRQLVAATERREVIRTELRQQPWGEGKTGLRPIKSKRRTFQCLPGSEGCKREEQRLILHF